MHLPFCVTINVYRGLYAVLKHIILTLYRDLTPTSPHKSTRTSNTNFQTWYATNSYHHLQNEHNSHPTPHGVTQKPPHQSSKHGRPWCPYTHDQSSGQSFVRCNNACDEPNACTQWPVVSSISTSESKNTKPTMASTS